MTACCATCSVAACKRTEQLISPIPQPVADNVDEEVVEEKKLSMKLGELKVSSVSFRLFRIFESSDESPSLVDAQYKFVAIYTSHLSLGTIRICVKFIFSKIKQQCSEPFCPQAV